MRLKNKVAIITGAKSGIGRATAARFAAEGAKVAAADIRDSRPEVLELTERGAEACFIQADVASSRQNVIVFLASDEASYMTGSVVTVDGGWTAH